MLITRDFQETISARVQRESKFAEDCVGKAASLFLNGEPKTVRLILRNLVNATTGFENTH